MPSNVFLGRFQRAIGQKLELTFLMLFSLQRWGSSKCGCPVSNTLIVVGWDIHDINRHHKSNLITGLQRPRDIWPFAVLEEVMQIVVQLSLAEKQWCCSFSPLTADPVVRVYWELLAMDRMRPHNDPEVQADFWWCQLYDCCPDWHLWEDMKAQGVGSTCGLWDQIGWVCRLST